MTTKKNGKKTSKRIDNQSFAERVNKVYSLLVNGYSTSEIMHNVALLDEWGVRERQMLNYTLKARCLLEEEAQRTRTSEIGKSIRRYEKMYRKMDSVGDYRGCLSAQTRIDDLLSLCESKKIDLKLNREELISPEIKKNTENMTSERLAEILGNGK